jgi:uncharacterized membrane protein
MPAMPPSDDRVERARPSVRSALEEGWHTLTAHVWTLIVAVLIYVAVESLSNVFSVPPGPGGPQQVVSVISPLGSILVTGPLVVGLAYLSLRAVRGFEPELDDLLAGFRRYVAAAGGMLLYGLAVTVGLVLLVVPGLVAMVRLSFTPYIIVDRELDPLDALRASWAATGGYAWSLFGLLMVSLLTLVGGLILLIVGAIPAIAWIATSWAAYYERATRTAGETAPGDADPVVT